MIFILTAKYIQREALEIFFGKLFPDGDAEVDVGAASRELITHYRTQYKRGVFQCELPRKLTSVCMSIHVEREV
jgi:hypothetical protein